MKAQAVVRLKFPSQEHLFTAFKALKPETKSPPTARSKVQIKAWGNNLTLNFEANDTSALRAAINSYLHWIALINETRSVVEALNKE